jgi:hypothetical protein
MAMGETRPFVSYILHTQLEMPRDYIYSYSGIGNAQDLPAPRTSFKNREWMGTPGRAKSPW